MSVDRLRARLADLDRRLLELVAERQRVAAAIGRAKRDRNLPTRDYRQEKEVIQRARALARELGLSPEPAEELMLILIRSALTVQERDRVEAQAGGDGRRALVIGGAGKMGRWFGRFLASQGFEVEVADPAGPVAGFGHYPDWREPELDHELVLVAAPLRESRKILEGLAERQPHGLVFDIGSLKTPLRSGLTALVEAGARVTSIHPMFGPDTEMLSGRHVIFVDLGVPAATGQARQLFASTTAIQVEMDLDSHDRLIAYVLGLSHAVNIAFFTALAESGEAAPKLAQLSSTTFDQQVEVASRVAEENPHLYFEIQSLNDYGGESLGAFVDAVSRLRSMVAAGDEPAFVELMRRGRRYLRGHGSRSG